MTLEEARKALSEQQIKEFAYGHAMGLMNFDGMTVAPRDTYIARGKTMSVLSGEIYKLSTGKESMELLDYLTEHKDELSAAECRVLDLRAKDMRELRSIPIDEFVAYTALINEASTVWEEARDKSDYAMFEPYLDKIIDSNRRIAERVDPDKDAYDYCLNKFESGLTQARCDEFFGGLREHLVPLIKRVQAAAISEPDFMSTIVPVSSQAKLSAWIMDTMGVDKNRCFLSTSAHPFTTDFSKNDVRITTHYKENAFASSMYSVIHESGHALYELHTADEYMYTDLSGGVSMGVHESQSRFFENIIGRSRPFVELLRPELIRLCPEIGEPSVDELYRAMNHMQPSLIRTEADELTYSMHIMVRYEIERAFMSGKVKTKELPELWNSLYKEYLGLDVPDDAHGILQDSHWSGGMIGYFPSYALGSAYGAQLVGKMRETVDVDASVRAGNFAPISSWLEERIWRHGKLHEPTTLIESAMEAPFDSKYFTDYLEAKVSEIYGV